MNIENALRSILPSADKYVEGAELLTDGGLENWASATDLTSWTEDISGSSTINREAVEKHGGTYASRHNIVGGVNAGVYQGGVAITPGKRFRFSFWYKTPASGVALAWVYAGAGFDYSLESTSGEPPAWVSGAGHNIRLPVSTSWRQFVIEADALPGYDSYLFSVSGAEVSGDYYFDDLSVKELTPAGIVSCWVPGAGNKAVNIFGRGHTGTLGTGVSRLPAMKFLGPELLLNADFESWASATDCNSWAENLSGTSTVNRESSGPKSGTYCVRVDSDGSGSEAYIRQSPTLYSGKTYRLSFWHKVQSGAQHRDLVRVTVGAFSYYLQADSSWKKSGDAGFSYFFTSGLTGTAWRHHSIFFSLPAGWSGLVIGLASCYSEVSKSIYVDKASLREVLPGPVDASLGWRFDGTANAVITTNQNSPGGPISVGFWYRRSVNGTSFNPAVSLTGGSDSYPSVLASRFLDTIYYPVGWFGADNWRYWSAASPGDNTIGGRWVFLVFTMSGNGQYDLQNNAEFYLDGVAQDDPSPTIEAYTGVQSARTTVAFGKAGSNYFTGDIAIPFIADRVLSAQEVANIYNSTKGFFFPRS